MDDLIPQDINRMPSDRPALPLPPSLRGFEKDTFTYDSIARRLPQIARQTSAENNFLPQYEEQVQKLLHEIPTSPIRALTDDRPPDASNWLEYCLPYLGQNWLEPPWFFVETYFYRRILEATGYFREGPGREFDPFRYQKQQGLEVPTEAIRSLSAQVQKLLSKTNQQSEALANLLAVDLWGNQADLSMWPAGDGPITDLENTEQQKKHTLVDDTPVIVKKLLEGQSPLNRVDFIIDNAGFELIADLALVLYLLEQGIAHTVHLHAKPHPTFVSDATIKDIRQTIDFLRSDQDLATASTGHRLQALLDEGRLSLQTHWFWTSPLAMWHMPTDLKGELAFSDLLICKGDANYRRLLGDRHWPYTTSFADIVCYLPAPLVALRTLKAEVACGLSEKQVREITRRDPEWLVNGQWGVIQFADPITYQD
jgi:uncharacterized protein with ATP-grasp and redox domains